MFSFKSFRASMKSVFESTDKMLEEMEKEMEDPLDFDMSELKDVPAGAEKEVVQEETRPDGTRVVTKTIIRRTVKTS